MTLTDECFTIAERPVVRDEVIEAIGNSRGYPVIVREQREADAEHPYPQFDALVTEYSDHTMFPWIQYSTTSGRTGTFVFNVDTVEFRWLTPRNLEITNPGEASLVMYMPA